MKHTRGILLPLLLVVVAAPALGLPDQAPARSRVQMKVGDRERYTFAAGGVSIGEQTAECTKLAQYDGRPVADWRFAIRLNLGQPLAPTPTKIDVDGTLSVDETGSPVRLDLTANANGVPQKATYTFGNRKAQISVEVAGTPVRREVPWEKGQSVQLNNLLTAFSIATQTMRIQPGQTDTLMLFSAQTMGPLSVKFVARPKTQPVTVGGKPVECVVCDTGLSGSIFYLARSSGAVIRLEVPAQKLVIQRQ